MANKMKRRSNRNLKDRRARSWQRGKERKEERKLDQEERTKRNKRRKQAGEPTPWERAKAKRAEGRAGLQDKAS